MSVEAFILSFYPIYIFLHPKMYYLLLLLYTFLILNDQINIFLKFINVLLLYIFNFAYLYCIYIQQYMELQSLKVIKATIYI